MGKLMVGAGKACINPPEELFPMGAAEAVLDDLHVRALVIENGDTRFLLLEFEAGHPPYPDFKREIADKYRFPFNNVITTSIHNHSACEWGRNDKKIFGKMKPKVNEKALAYEVVVREGVFAAIEQAVAALRPAKYGYGEGKSFINCNRDCQMEDGHWLEAMNLAGPTDKTLSVLKFEDYEGNLIAVLLNYCCHESVAINAKDVDGKVKLTPGFPGYACEYIEQRYGNGAIALWTCGAGADQGAIFSASMFPRTYEHSGYSELTSTPPGTQYVIQKHLGQTHAVDAIRAMQAIVCTKTQMQVRSATTTVELQGQVPPEDADMMLNHLTICNMVKKARPDLYVNGEPPKKELVKMIPQGTVELNMQLIILGDVAYVGFAGEPYVEIGLKCKDASPMRNTVIIAPTSRESAEFIVSDASAHHDSFQSYSRVYPGNSDTPIVNGMLKMFDDALNQ